VAADPRFGLHDTGPGHPERPARLEAVLAGITEAGLDDQVVTFEPTAAPLELVEKVHPGRYLDALRSLADSGGGHIDADTAVSARSFDAALHAAGAVLDATARLEAGEADLAFCAVRPPGHHATPGRPMGFCLVNNVAVTAMALADRGERVLVVDYDAHHGNGTQAVFYDDPRVLYVSFHQDPLYPGTGRITETGEGEGVGTTVNFPFPPGTTGDVYRAAVDEVVAPVAEAWRPTWLLVSAGFDAHRRDPLTDMGLTSGDFADLSVALRDLVPAGRCVLLLEGGYDLDALAASTGAVLSAVTGGSHRPEAASSGGPGRRVVDRVLGLRAQSSDG